MSPHNNESQDDRDATNYVAAPPPASTDTHGTRYSDAPADPHATAYTPTADATDNAGPGRLPRRFGGYELLSELGHGGMGVVYRAREFTPERMVALKVIRSGELADAEDVRRFRQEADEAARLDHPHITPVYEVGEHGGLHFFTMKLVEGGSLSQHLGRYQNDPKAAAKLTATAARAVHYAHQRQLLHRDLKPGNILLDAAGQPHVADFGLAKRMEEGDACVTRSNAVVGTPEYMAPEQARGEKRLTTVADVYALGGVLYALLTGQPPFRGASGLVMQKVLTEEPTPPSKIRPGVPRDLETICLKCLQKEPARRYGSAEALAEDLERWLRGEPIKGRPVGRLERGWLWCRRNPAAAVLSTAFATALLVGAGVSTYFGLDAREHARQTGVALGKVTETNKQMEAALARSILRPMGHDVARVNDTEIEAVWELAGSNERIRLLFIEQALRRPITTRQLQTRANLAVHAVAGLDPMRRQEVGKLLLDRLRVKGSDFNIRTDCVLIGQALGEWSPEYAEAATQQAADAIGKTDNTHVLFELAKAVASLAPRLEPEKAARLAAARQSVDAMERTTDPHALAALAKAVASLAPRLEPEEAGSVAGYALEAMGKKKALDANALYKLAEVEAALAPRLKSAAAETVANQAIEGMSKATDPYVLSVEAETVATLAPRLESAAAATAANKAVETISKSDNFTARRELAKAVAALSPQLDAGDAATVARQAVEHMGNAVDHSILDALAEAAAALAPRLSAQGAETVAKQAEAKGKSNPWAVEPLAKALAALAPRFMSDKAGTVALQALEALDQSDDPKALHSMAVELAALAPQLGTKDAESRAKAVSTKVVEAMHGAINPYYLPSLEEAVAALAPWLGPDDVATVAERAVDLMDQTDDPNALHSLAQAVAILAPWLKHEEAKSLATKAAKRAVEEMMNMPDTGSLCKLAESVAALAPWLDEETTQPAALDEETTQPAVDAVDQMLVKIGPLANLTEQKLLAESVAALAPRLRRNKATVTLQKIVETMERTNYPVALGKLEEAAAALAPWLEPEERAAASSKVVEAMGKTTDANTLHSLAAVVTVLAPRLEPEAAADVARQAKEAMDKTTNPLVLRSLAESVAALTAQLDPKEAAQLAAAARQAVETIGKTDNSEALLSLAAAEAEMVQRPGPEAEAQLAAARQAVDAIGKTDDSEALLSLAAAFAALAPRLEPASAESAARQALEAMGKTANPADPVTLLSLVDTVRSLIVRAAPEDVSRRTRLLTLAVANSATVQVSLFGLAPLTEGSRPLPGRFTEQQLVDFMKMPTCPEPARQVIVLQLGSQCGRPFANQWEFVDWAREHRADLDLASPPVRPTQP